MPDEQKTPKDWYRDRIENQPPMGADITGEPVLFNTIEEARAYLAKPPIVVVPEDEENPEEDIPDLDDYKDL